MKIGIGLFLVTLGAIFRYAIDDSWSAFDRAIVGLILMIVGAIAFVTGVVLEYAKRPAAASLAPHNPVPGLPPSVPPSAPPVAPTPTQPH